MCSTNVFFFFCFLDSLNACTSNCTHVQPFLTLTRSIRTTIWSHPTTSTTNNSQTTTTITNGSQTTPTTPKGSQTMATGNLTPPTTTSHPAGFSKKKKKQPKRRVLDMSFGL